LLVLNIGLILIYKDEIIMSDVELMKTKERRKNEPE